MSHADVGADGSPAFRAILDVSLELEGMSPRPALDRDVLPPNVVGIHASLQTLFQQMLGPMGRGVRWFVYDGVGMNACGDGGLAVPYDGERYTYQTPIPGCPRT